MPEGMTTETARKVEQAMHYVQKPVIVQVCFNTHQVFLRFLIAPSCLQLPQFLQLMPEPADT